MTRLVATPSGVKIVVEDGEIIPYTDNPYVGVVLDKQWLVEEDGVSNARINSGALAVALTQRPSPGHEEPSPRRDVSPVLPAVEPLREDA